MTTEQQEEVGPVTVQIGVCGVCHALYLIDGTRDTSPCHGADTLAVLATLTIGPNAQVTGEWGFGTAAPAPEPAEEPAPAAEEEKPSPVEEEAPPAPETIKASELLPAVILAFLVGDEAVGTDQLRGMFEDAGAEPEEASTAVGRLSAVGGLLQELQLARELAPIVPAPPEAEKSPENS